MAEGRVKMMNKIRLALYRFFIGRNGADDLYRASFLFYLILFVISLFVRSTVLNVILLVLAIWIVFRALSKNIPARRRENKAYLKVKNRISRFFDMVGRRFRDWDSHFYKRCPHCHEMLRLPLKKGTHTCKCPRCKTRFTVKCRRNAKAVLVR